MHGGRGVTRTSTLTPLGFADPDSIAQAASDAMLAADVKNSSITFTHLHAMVKITTQSSQWHLSVLAGRATQTRMFQRSKVSFTGW